MKPAAFAYHRPDTLDEALALLSEHGSDAKPLAGGQSLVPAMNFRLARPAVLVDLAGLEGLRGITVDAEGAFRIGAMTTQRTVERDVRTAASAPLLDQTMPWIAHPQIRNRGTIGGSLAHADPAAELPAVALAMDATLTVRGAGGTRRVPAREFFTGLFTTAMEPGELLVEIEVAPENRREPGRGTAFVEVARRHGDYALVGVATRVALDEGGACSAASIALLSVGDGPVLAEQAAEALMGRRPDAGVMTEAATLAAEKDCDPPGDIHASAAYRRSLTEVLVRRALGVAFGRAGPPLA